MYPWSSVVWAVLWAILFMITVVGCCRSVGSHAARATAERTVPDPNPGLRG